MTAERGRQGIRRKIHEESDQIDSGFVTEYFQAPESRYLDNLRRSSKIQYFPARIPPVGLSSEKKSYWTTLSKDREASKRFKRTGEMLVKPLFNQIDLDFPDCRIALQGVAALVGGKIDTSAIRTNPNVRSVWRLIKPYPIDKVLEEPLDLRQPNMPLESQSIMSTHFMFASATRQREINSEHAERIFPALVVYDLDLVNPSPLLSDAPYLDGIPKQVRTIELPKGRAQREKVVLKLYVCDFPL